MSKLILQTLETGFEISEKRIFEYNPQVKNSWKICFKTGFENPEKES